MENCLVTKLKGVVDNDNLLKLGELRFKIRNTGSKPQCSFYTPVGIEIKVIGNGLFTYEDGKGNRTEHLSSYITQQGGWSNILPENVDITISIISKYYINQFLLYNGSININDFVSTNLTRLEFINCILSESISVDTIVRNLPNLNEISLLNANNIFGDVADFAPLINLTVLVLGTKNQISGDLLNFATRQIVAGRTTASITSNWNGNLKFNGENILNSSNNILSWEQSGSNYVVTMNAGPDFIRTVTVDSNGNIVQ